MRKTHLYQCACIEALNLDFLRKNGRRPIHITHACIEALRLKILGENGLCLIYVLNCLYRSLLIDF